MGGHLPRRSAPGDRSAGRPVCTNGPASGNCAERTRSRADPREHLEGRADEQQEADDAADRVARQAEDQRPGAVARAGPTPNQSGLPGLSRTLWKTRVTPSRSSVSGTRSRCAGRDAARDQQDVGREPLLQGSRGAAPASSGAIGQRLGLRSRRRGQRLRASRRSSCGSGPAREPGRVRPARRRSGRPRPAAAGRPATALRPTEASTPSRAALSRSPRRRTTSPALHLTPAREPELARARRPGRR